MQVWGPFGANMTATNQDSGSKKGFNKGHLKSILFAGSFTGFPWGSLIWSTFGIQKQFLIWPARRFRGPLCRNLSRSLLPLYVHIPPHLKRIFRCGGVQLVAPNLFSLASGERENTLWHEKISCEENPKFYFVKITNFTPDSLKKALLSWRDRAHKLLQNNSQELSS